MSSSDEKIRLFLNAIGENLEMLRKEIEDEIAAVRKAEQEKAGKEADERSEAYIKIESANVRTRANRQQSLLETELRNELAATRSDITGKVFETVSKKLGAFTKTAAYADFMKKSAAGFAAVYGAKPYTVFVKTPDLQYKDILLSASGIHCGVEADDTIIIGGCKASSSASNIALDDTLDSRLEAQRQGFYENSGLSVESI